MHVIPGLGIPRPGQVLAIQDLVGIMFFWFMRLRHGLVTGGICQNCQNLSWQTVDRMFLGSRCIIYILMHEEGIDCFRQTSTIRLNFERPNQQIVVKKSNKIWNFMIFLVTGGPKISIEKVAKSCFSP